LHRRPDRHPTIVSSLNIFRRDTPGINTQVTALQRGYLRRSEAKAESAEGSRHYRSSSNSSNHLRA
jgi:hypothetical protein